MCVFFWGLQKAFYSIIKDNVKFIFLNTVELQDGAMIPEEQIAWQQEELMSNHYFVILTHQSLSNDLVTSNGKSRSIRNRKEIQDIHASYPYLKNMILYIPFRNCVLADNRL